MKVLQIDSMPCGTKVQLERWELDAHLNIPIDIVAAYPKALETMPGQFAPKRGRSFRLAIEFDNEQDSKQAYESLLNGDASLIDYVNKYREKELAICL